MRSSDRESRRNPYREQAKSVGNRPAVPGVLRVALADTMAGLTSVGFVGASALVLYLCLSGWWDRTTPLDKYPWVAVALVLPFVCAWRIGSIRRVFAHGAFVRAKVVSRHESFRDVTLIYAFEHEGKEQRGYARVHKDTALASRTEGQPLEVVFDPGSPASSYALEQYDPRPSA